MLHKIFLLGMGNNEMYLIKKENYTKLSEVKDNKVTIDVKELKKNNVFFATPCYGGLITDQFFISMFKTTQQFMKMGIPFRVSTLRNESLIPRARNMLVAMYLETDCSHLMFIDADIEWEPDSVIRMLAMDKDLLCGAYPKKTLPVNYAITLKFSDPARQKVKIDNGAVEVLDASTGFMLIKRGVFEKMMQHYPELHYKNDSALDPKFNPYCYSFFDTKSYKYSVSALFYRT